MRCEVPMVNDPVWDDAPAFVVALASRENMTDNESLTRESAMFVGHETVEGLR